MSKLYVLYNNYLLSNLERNVDEHIPLKVNAKILGLRYYFLQDNNIAIFQYIRLSYKNFSQLTLSGSTKQLISFTLMPNQNSYVYNTNLDITNFIRIKQSITIGTSIKFPNAQYSEISLDCNIILNIYKNAILIDINSKIEKCLLIYEDEKLGVITDFLFNIAAFVSFNLSSNEINQIIDISNVNNVIQVSLNELIGNQCFMENTLEIANVILSLKNISYWNLLYYGFNKYLINNEFCVEFAAQYLSKYDSNNSDIITLAGLLPSEYSQAYMLVEKLLDKDKTLDEQTYNKVWFYISNATEMKRLNII